MSIRITWSPKCHEDIRGMRYRTAERICMAVHAFARGEEVAVHALDPLDEPRDPCFVVIRAKGGYAVARLFVREERIEVWRVRASVPVLRAVRPLIDEPPPVDPDEPE